jgi:quercetin dioxygenase-like cupin family protein
MTTKNHIIINLAENATASSAIPSQSILSRSLLENDRLKWILFQFAEGQELSEHTASMPAVINIIEGEFECKIGDEPCTLGAGTLIYMEPNTSHSLKAINAASFYLMLLK